MPKSAHKKKYAVFAVLKEGRSVTAVAKELGVARKTIYSWLKRYKESPPRNKSKAFKPRYASGKKHPRAVAPSAKHALIRLIVAHPEWGCRKYSQELQEKGINLGYFGVYQLLDELSASAPDLRKFFARNYSGPGRFKNDVRLEVTRKVVEEKIPISQVAASYGVARKTIYKWLNKYNKSVKLGILGPEALADAYVTGEAHPRALYPKISEELLGIIAQKPELSVHKLKELVPASSWTVWKILDRNNLNLYQQRLAYAESQGAAPRSVFARFLDRIRLVLEQFIPSLAPAPPPFDSLRSLRTFGPRFIKPFFISSFLTFLISSGLISWVKLLGAVSLTSAIGLVFATVALLLGSVFFLYSLKYYITLAIVLSFSQRDVGERNGRGPSTSSGSKGFLSWLLGLANGNVKSPKATTSQAIGLEPSLEHITLKRYPKVSVHIPLYNEKNVVERLIAATTNFDYKGDYEVILADDSTDETTQIIRDYLKSVNGKRTTVNGEGWTLTQAEVRPGVVLKHLHRTTRSGFKGGALRLALRVTDPKAEFISVFDADFVPYPDTLTLFLKYFQATAGSLDFRRGSRVQGLGSSDNTKPHTLVAKPSPIAAVQGYQWHVLNKSENWITRGIRSEYAGSYVIERSGEEIYSGLKQISGAVYMIRRDVLEELGWETSITEDFQLTLKLYEKGYKVVYTPYIQAPAECVSTLKRLIRQRMRWAEGHSNNVRKMFTRLIYGQWSMVNGQKEFTPSPLTLSEKLEFLYLSPYYLQAFFFLVGTISWLISETVFQAGLPFWTGLWGWSLVFTNLFSLPLMNSVGLFLEESEEKDYQGILSFILLSYIVVPFQAYAALKGFIQKEEGPWFRTPKTGHITDVFARGRFYRFITGILPGRKGNRVQGVGYSELQPKTYNLKPTLALSTANNTFSSFNIKARKNQRWVGRLFVTILLLISTTLITYAPYIPVDYNPDIPAPAGGVLLSPDGHQSRLPDFSLVKEAQAAITTNKDTLDTSFSLETEGLKLSGDAKDFSVREEPGFSVEYRRNIFKKIADWLTTLIGNDSEKSLEVTVIDTDGRKVKGAEVNKNGDDSYEVVIDPDTDLETGKYSLIVQDDNGNGLIQDFTWGVLAINTNKSIYLPGDIAHISMAVLDEGGKMVCDAGLTLQVKNPNSEIQNLSVKNGSIKVNGECEQNSMTLNPDYETYYKVQDKGVYELTLAAETKNGIYAIRDSFEARAEVDFDVERIGPTRINPNLTYPVVLRVTSNKDYRGFIEESVPGDFKIFEIGQEQLLADFGLDVDLETGLQEFLEVKEIQGRKELSWFVDWKEGETYNLAYRFDSPNIIPFIFLLGPLQIDVFKEVRQWQLAVDALTLNNLVGFETEGTEEAISVSGGPVVDNAAEVRSGTGSLKLNGGADRFDIAMITGGTTDSDNDFILGFAIRFTTLAPSSTSIFLDAREDSPGILWQLQMQTGGDLELLNAAGSTVDTVTSPFTVDTWHFIEIRWQHSASGAYDLFIDGDATNIAETGVDLTDGGAIGADDALYAFQDMASGTVYVDDVYAYSGGSGTTDFLVNAEVFGYQSDNATATSDAGNDLDQNEWDDTGDTVGVDESDANSAGYTANAARSGDVYFNDTKSRGLGPGPSGDSNIDGDSNIQGAKWIHRLDRGNGSGTTHSKRWGNDTDTVQSATVSLTTDPANFFQISEDQAADVPLSTEYFAMGIQKSSGGREIYAKEMWAMLLHTPDDTFTGIAYSDEGVTALGSVSVCLAVNNDASPTCNTTNGSGVFTITKSSRGGDQLTFYIDGGTDVGNSVTIADGGNIISDDNLRVYEDHVLVRHETGTNISIVDMDAYDNDQNADDMLYDAEDAATDSLDVESGKELFVYNSYTFDPDGDVDTVGAAGNLQVDNTATGILDTVEAGDSTNSIGGDVIVDSGATMTINADTTINGGDITMSGTSPTVNTTAGTPTVTMAATGAIGGGTTPSITFYNLSTSGSGTTTISDTITVNNDVSVGAGTTLTNNATVTVTGDVSVATTATLTVAATLNIDGGALTTAGTGSIGYSSTPTVDIDGTGTLGGGTGSITFYILDLGDGTSDTTTLSTNNINIDSGLVVSANQVFAMGTNSLTIGSTSVTDSGDITIPISGGTTQSASGTVTILSSASGTADWEGAGAFDVYNLTIGNGTAFTVDNDTGTDVVLDVANDFTITTNAKFNASSNAIFQVGNDWSNSGTFEAGTGAVTMDAQDSGNTLGGTMTGSSAFYSITFSDGGASGVWTFNANATVDNDFTIAGGSVTAPSGTLSVGHDFGNYDAFVHNSGTVALTGVADTTQTVTSTTALAFNSLSVTGGDRVINFEASQDFMIAVDANLTLTGTSCTALLVLRSTTAGTQFTLFDNVGGTNSIDYVDIQDSNASEALTATNSVDSDNNSNWTIAANACIGASTDTSSTATGYSFQRKTFWDSANARYWLFYHDGTHIEVRYSSDATTWNVDDDTLAYDTNDFSVWWQQIGVTEYVWLAVTTANDILVRRGTLTTTNVTWDTEANVLAFTGGGASDDYSYPYISLDSSNYMWVGARYYNGTNYVYKAVRSDDSDTGDATWSGVGFGTTISEAQLSDDQANSNVFGNIVPLASQDMYATFVVNTALEGCLWDDSDGAWEDSSGAACSPAGAGTTYALRSSDGPLKIDDAGNPGTLPGSTRQVIQTSGGTLYSVANDGGSCEVWMSADGGGTWSEQDSANNPSCNSGSFVSVGVDSGNTLHIFYMSNSTTYSYVTFSTSTHLFGSAETVDTPTGTDGTDAGSISIDSNDEPHVVYYTTGTSTSTQTEYFNSYNTGEAWTCTPGNMVDGSTSTYASSDGDLCVNLIQLNNGNTNDGTDLGTITKVELRVYGYTTGTNNDVILRPVFSGSGDGDNHIYRLPVGSGNADWSSYFDITSDTNAPGTWTWPDVQNLDVDVENQDPGVGEMEYVSKVEIQVTYISTNNNKILYSNRVSGATGGSWDKTPVEVETCTDNCKYADITIDEDDLPEISYININDSDLTAAVGNVNDAASFTLHDPDATVSTTSGQAGTSIGIDQAGNTWISYKDSTNTIFLAKRTDGSETTSWTTGWSTVDSGNVGYEPSIAIITSDIYVFYEEDASDNIVYDRYDSGDSSWLGETELAAHATDTYQDVHVRWSFLNNNDGYFIDYLFSDGTDVYWNYLDARPVNIDDPSDFRGPLSGNRQLVRTSGGTLYAVLNDGGNCEVWKSSDGTSWAIQDSANDPACSTTSSAMGAAIDSGDVIHIIYEDDGAGDIIKYITFTVATDSFGTEETVTSMDTPQYMAIAIDSANVPHVAARTFITNHAVEYSNRVGDSWDTTPVLLEEGPSANFESVSITINEDDIPEISYIYRSAARLNAAVGDDNDPTAGEFTVQTVDSSVNPFLSQVGSSIAVDSSGNTWIAYLDEDGATDFITLAKHNDADAWSTWTINITNSNAGSEPSIAIDGSDIYTLYRENAADVAYDKYDDSAGTWAGETILLTGTYSNVSAKWAFEWNNYGPNRIDFLFYDNTDVYWSFLHLRRMPTNVDDASDFGTLPGAGRQVVRTSGGTLYSVANDAGNCEVWKSTDEGNSWAIQDSADDPACNTTENIAVAIDGNDDLHIIYEDDSTAIIRYITFDTPTDQFGTEDTVTGMDTPGDMAIAIDSSNIPHVAARTQITNDAVEYSNWVGSSWDASPTSIEETASGAFNSISIAIDEDNLPEVSYINSLDNDLTAAEGDANDATAFTDITDVDVDVNDVSGTRVTSIGVDSSGNTWIAYVDENGTDDYVTLVKHNDADAWSTWQTPVTDSDVGNEPSIVVDSTTIYVFYEDDQDDIVYNFYTSSWGGEKVLEMHASLQDVKGRWSRLNNPSYTTYGVDYLYSDATDVFYNRLSVGPIPGSQDAIDTMTSASLIVNISAVVDDVNTDVSLIFVDAGSPGQVSYKRWDSGTQIWDSTATLVGDAADDSDFNVTLSYDTDANELYAIWIDFGPGDIDYATCVITTECNTAGEWAAETTWKSTGTNRNVTSNYSGATRIFAEWTEGTASPYHVQFDTIIIPEHLWLFFGLGPFLPLLLKRRRKHRRIHRH